MMFHHFLMLLIFLDVWHVCARSCHDHLPNQMRPWKLCVKRNRNDNIQLKIFKSLVVTGSWLAIGFPEVDGKIIDFFLVTNSTKSEGDHNYSINLKQSPEQHVDCEVARKKSPTLVIINCKTSFNKTHRIIHLTSHKISIVYLSGMKKPISTKDLGKILVSNGTKLSFYPYESKVKQDAGSTAMKLLRNYGKSMAAIIGIAFFLTTFITVTICCCCKKDKPPMGTFKEKDVSVSFYRDNGEVENENDSSDDDDDDDEKVSFIRNNNAKNSNV